MTSYLKNLSNSAIKTKTSCLNDLKVKIGLEIHARILSKTKIFSDSNSSELNSSLPNSNVSHFDIALPGTMPSLNKRCVEAGLLSALALGCKINGVSRFERKHYFYADLPAGYQITQQRKPLAFNGLFRYPVIDPKSHKLNYKQCRIRQLQLEHDSARSLKTDNLALKFDKSYPKDFTLIDHNRTGLGLMEIVTEPDFENAFDSYSFVRELALTLKSIGTCTANMSNGEFRVDVNVSSHHRDSATGMLGQGVRVELKNLNSFSAVLKATEIEIKRQKTLITSGQAILRQTRTYDSAEHKTVAIRTKEDQYDYRFMPEPNLLPLVVYPSQSFSPISEPHMKCVANEELIFDADYLDRTQSIKDNNELFADLDKVKSDFTSKTLPQQRRNFLQQTYGLSDEISFIFTANDLDKIMTSILTPGWAQLKTVNVNKDLLVKVLLNEYLNQVNTNVDLDRFSFEIKCKKIASYVQLLADKRISKRIHYKFFAMLFEVSDRMDMLADELAKEKNLYLITDQNIVSKSVERLFASNPKAIADYKTKLNKRTKVFDFFVGRVHKDLNDLADQDLVDETVKNCLQKLIQK